MLLLAIVGTLVGAVLAQRFKIMILIPATTLLIGAAITAGILQGHPVWRILLLAGSACISTQMGYVAGLGIRHFLEVVLAQRPATFRPDAPAHHSAHTKVSSKVA
jgi:hypothetical protein